jgi:hypothetical protein
MRWILFFSFLAVSPLGAVEVAGLDLAPPAKWESVAPSSSMRVAQWQVPPGKGKGDPGEAVIFYFGPGQGGDAPSNVNRWLSTLTLPSGGAVKGDVQTRKIQGINVTQVTAYGTYASGMPGAGLPPVPKRGYGLSGAILEGPQGSVFIRFTGPEALVKANLPAFTKFVDSAKPAKGSSPAQSR